MLDEGAVWVPSAAPTRASSMNETGWEGSTLLAVAVRPLQVVVSTLYQEEGWYQPLSEITSRAKGRVLLLGETKEALLAALDGRRLADVEELAGKARADRLVSTLLAHPSNTHLREVVYHFLLASWQSERVADVAGAIVKTEHAAAEDRQAWLAARLSLEPGAKEVERLIGDLRDAISREPKATSLYLMLGAAYEKSKRPDAVELARACYLKASSTGWGESKTAADAAVARLDGES
jgi:cytochrome c-type biogenesis protein CcmH/NrfG